MNDGVRVRVGVSGGGDLSAPDLSQTPRLVLEQWESGRDGRGAITIAWGCFWSDTHEWSVDASELAFGKLAEIASGTAARIRGEATPMHGVDVRVGKSVAVHELAADVGSAHARTFIGFTFGQVHACFVTCVDASCADAIEHAEIEGAFVAQPSPGIVLRSLGFIVHHPHGALGGIAFALTFAAAIAIATRPGRR